jgi:tRNA threonylcarbamoyladenosine biosynthesis protein TsaE
LAKTTTTHSAEETQALGVELGQGLKPGGLVALRGDLGSGKTCMIQGICRALEVADYVTSPTFILINEYAGRLQGRDLPVYHFDLYRLRGAEELENLGAEEYFYGRGISLVEWAERAGNLLPEGRTEVLLEHVGGDERRITLRGSGF